MSFRNDLTVGSIDHFTKSLKYSCFGVNVCETVPWLSYVASDDEIVIVELSYVGKCD